MVAPGAADWGTRSLPSHRAFPPKTGRCQIPIAGPVRPLPLLLFSPSLNASKNTSTCLPWTMFVPSYDILRRLNLFQPIGVGNSYGTMVNNSRDAALDVLRSLASVGAR